ncbi:SLC13 family permease [Halomonas piscis]|uniref:SLC13 family permease n=1 Tax=Halomonas piscis TaxID=3031727 RepID=UPI00289BAE1B|nr:SLC13 family permease [Halomonas piscis]
MMAWAILVSLCVFLAVLVSGRVKPATAFTGLATLYLLTGQVDTATLLRQYTNPALATLLLLLLVSLALERSPLLDWLSDRLLSSRPRLATAKLMGAGAVLSAFLNNTAVVAAFLGAVSRQKRLAPSRLLIPLSYASILGGVTTLVGTSTNLVVNSFYLNATGEELGMFQFALVGLPVALISLGVLLWRAGSLPSHPAENIQDRLAYFLAAELTDDSPLAGKSIEANGLRNLDGLYLLEIERDGRLLSPVAPEELLQPGDTLVFTGEVNKVQALKRFPGLRLFGHQASDLLATNLVEVVVSHQSELPGKTLQEVDFRSMFSAGVVGIRRGERRLEGQLGQIPLRVGDCLLMAVSADFRQHRNLDRNFHLLSGSFTRPQLGRRQSLAALGGFAGVIGSASLGLIPLFHGLLLLMAGLLATRILTVDELRRRFPFALWLIIGSALAMAQALENSGAAALLARGMQQLFSGYGVFAAFAGCYVLTLLLTETVTNNAAAALTFPVAWSTAQAFGADPLPFILAVAYGASACFLIPFGYQTHLMVYSPGHYRIADFLKTGLPVSLAYSASVLILTPWVFPF